MIQNLLMMVLAQTPSPEQAKSWTDWLAQSGGWGVAAVEFGVLVVVCRWFIAALDKKDAKADANYDKVIATLERQNETYKAVSKGS